MLIVAGFSLRSHYVLEETLSIGEHLWIDSHVYLESSHEFKASNDAIAAVYFLSCKVWEICQNLSFSVRKYEQYGTVSTELFAKRRYEQNGGKYDIVALFVRFLEAYYAS